MSDEAGPSSAPQFPEPKESLRDIMARKKREMKDSPQPSTSFRLIDPYANATASNYITRGATALCFDPETNRHRCEWDDKYPECPDRLTAVVDRCYEKGYFNSCIQIPNPIRTDLYQRIIEIHTVKHFEELKRVCYTLNMSDMEFEASKYDSVYFNRHTFDSACRSLSTVLNLVEAVARRDVQNGMALVRPPGHHAMTAEFNGYCFFNNVAVAAEMCIQDDLAKRILIVDIDVHHGQGTQKIFYDRKDVLYFSIHRYEHGSFWPNLIDGNFHCIGAGEGVGYNVNVPLNATSLSDEDYLAIVFSILLPIGYEFNPDLVIVSAGYDSCIGDEKGRMNVTPGFYAHLITHLSGLARGQIAVCLEGGYFLPTLAEGTVLTIKALLGGPCPILERFKGIHPAVIETICNVKRTLLNKWNCFKYCETLALSEVASGSDEHKYQLMYVGEPEIAPFATRRCYPELTGLELNFFLRVTKSLKERYKAAMFLPVHLVYDDKMLLHAPTDNRADPPEKPARLKAIMEVFKEFGINERVVRVPIYRKDYSNYNVHFDDYFECIGPDFPDSADLYSNRHTRDCVNIAVSGLLTLCDDVMLHKARSGVAVIRPPGHHAEHDRAMGFCFANNVAIAANYLHMRWGHRILIVDFDIHHGNGTQNFFYNNSNVMVISIHRYDDGKYFPTNSHGSYKYDGYGCGQGFNINIPFSKDRMGDTEYIAVFQNIVLPAAYSFGPHIILVSAGFDAGINDPLGGYKVNPETFGHLVQMLKPLAEGRIILALEGGYNTTTTAYGMAICTKVLLGDPVIMPKNIYKTFSSQACKTIRDVTNHFKKYFSVFNINKKLSLIPVLCKKVNRFTDDHYSSELYKVVDIEKAEDSEVLEREFREFIYRIDE